MSRPSRPAIRKITLLSLALSIILPIGVSNAVVPSDPICPDQWSRRDSKKEVLQKCVDQLSNPSPSGIGNLKEPPCAQEFQALIAATKELRDCLNH
jgi:hypothetical protein